MEELKPKIYVACLASYNNGHLYGDWMDAAQDPEDISTEIKAMLAKSPMPNAEEWAIHATEDFGDCIIEESSDLEAISAIALFLEEHGKIGAALLSEQGFDIEDATEALEDYYAGEYETEKDFAISLFDELYTDIPEPICYYIDYEKFGRELFINDYYSVAVGAHVHVFHYH